MEEKEILQAVIGEEPKAKTGGIKHETDNGRYSKRPHILGYHNNSAFCCCVYFLLRCRPSGRFFIIK